MTLTTFGRLPVRSRRAVRWATGLRRVQPRAAPPHRCMARAGMRAARPVIVVSTGRSGSTMLSNIVRSHPELLSLSELFILLDDPAFPDGPISGLRFWEILSRPSGTLHCSSGRVSHLLSCCTSRARAPGSTPRRASHR